MARSTTFKYTVTVVSSGGNKYAIDGNTQQYVVLFPGCTYEFNQDDSTNATHPLRFATAAGYSPKLRLDLVFNDFIVNGVTKKKILILSDGTPWRPLIHVKDMARAIDWAIQYPLKRKFLALNVGSDKWTFTIKKLAQLISKTLGNIKVVLNKNSQPDKRSYTVDFSLFKKICKENQPKENINTSIKELAKNIIKSKFSFNNFRNSQKFIRLKTLTNLQDKNKLDKNLYWIKK